MKRCFWLLVVIGSVLGGCMGDTGGGGGVGGPINFSQGYVFIRRDDRNVYIADRSDYNHIGQLTSSGGNKHPSISRDGRRVVFVHTTASGTEIHSIPSSGGNESVVFSDSSRANFRNPVFSPDGRVIVFSFDQAGLTALGMVNADGSQFRTITPSTALFMSPSFGNDSSFVLAASGSSLATMSQIVTVTLASSVVTPVASDLGVIQSVVNRVVLSPNGAQAAFDGRISTGASRLVAFILVTRQAMVLTDYPSMQSANDSFPSWVSNSTIGFTSNSGGGDQIYEIAATGGSPNLVIPSAIEGWYGPN